MVVGAVIMVVTAVVTALVFGRFIRIINNVEQGQREEYSSHYAFIVGDNENEFWDLVYEAARSKAAEDGIYLENIKDSLNINYSTEDLLRVAINSSVDGIIYAGNTSDEVVELIDNAVSRGIGVSVLHNDMEQSQRQCFVGVSNYELGQMDATQILSICGKENLSDCDIALLVSGQMSEGAVNLIILAIEDALLTEVDESDFPEIETIKIEAEDTFSVEEDIRNLFVEKENLPDIVVCLESSYTQCVYQAVVDYNHVGDVQIIGYFYNEDILEAIDKDIVFSTISIDTKEMGESAVVAIEEYNEYGYTNSFLPIEIEIVDKSNVKSLIYQKEQETNEVTN